MTDFTIRPDCRLCLHPLGSERVLDLGETALANELKSTREESLAQDKFPLYLQQCGKCGHVQLPVVVKPERLFPPDYPYQSGTSPVFREHLKEFARTVSGMIPPGSTVLEIASNDGTLLREFGKLCHSAHGIDPAAKSRSYPVGGRHVVETSAFFTLAVAEQVAAITRSVYPAIVALNVFAHVDDLNDFTAGVAALLPDDGLFVFEVGYLPDVIERGLFDVVYHEHLSYHHLRPLVPFLAKHGLRLYDAHRVDSQGGSIRCFARKNLDPKWGMSPRVRLMLAAEEGLSVEPLNLKIVWLRSGVRQFVRSSPTGKLNIAGFGAPAKLTTFWQALQEYDGKVHLKMLDAYPSVIYDDNPAKVGRFTPGTGIPIRPSAELLADNPDFCIIFSWNFAEEIMARFPGYKGKWVIPLPEFRVVEADPLQAAYDDTWRQFAGDKRLT